MKLCLLCFFVIFFLFRASCLEPLTAEKLSGLNRLTGFSASKDSVVYSANTWDPKTGKTVSGLSIFPLNNPQQKRVLTSPTSGSDFSPSFSPDGRYVAFLSTRTGSSQIYVVPSSGSEKTVVQLTSYEIDIANLKWSRNGSFFLFTANVYVSCGNFSCTAQKDSLLKARGSNTGIVFTQLPVRHWDEWKVSGKASHLFIQGVTLNKNKSPKLSGAPFDVMDGLDADTPTLLSGSEQFDSSWNDNEISFTTQIINASTAWTTGWRVYKALIENMQPTTRTDISQTPARCQNPVYSPDGNYIAYLCMDRPGYEADKNHIVLHNRLNGLNTVIAQTWDRSPDSLVWVDSTRLIAAADDDGRHKLFLVGMTGNPTAIIDSGTNSEPIPVPQTNTWILSRSSLSSPLDLWSFALSTQISNLTQLTYLNREALSSIYLPAGISFEYQSAANNTRVQGWMLPPFSNSTSQHPVAVLIHGGPQGSWNDAWSYRWNPQIWASRGYGVLTFNIRGSTGFGQAFTDGVNRNWGGVPFIDLMSGLDWALNNYNWMNRSRVCACGASYGGYMINWINGHTNRFSCLVNHDGMFDTSYFYYSTDELWFPEWEFGGTPWQNPEGYSEWNPSLFVEDWQTPTLVIHGGLDFRIPETDGMATFTALQRRGIPSKLLYFPLENHWILNPSNSLIWYETILEWLDEYTANVPPYKPAPFPIYPIPSPKKPSRLSWKWIVPTSIACVLFVVVVLLMCKVYGKKAYYHYGRVQ